MHNVLSRERVYIHISCKLEVQISIRLYSITFFLFGCEVEPDETLTCKKKTDQAKYYRLQKIANRIRCVR